MHRVHAARTAITLQNTKNHTVMITGKNATAAYFKTETFAVFVITTLSAHKVMQHNAWCAIGWMTVSE
jgi:hypothetical protein